MQLLSWLVILVSSGIEFGTLNAFFYRLFQSILIYESLFGRVVFDQIVDTLALKTAQINDFLIGLVCFNNVDL